MMADAPAEPALSAAPRPMAHVALEIPSTFLTTTLRPTSVGSHHAATTITNTIHALVRDVDESWLSGDYSNTAREISRRNESFLRGIRLGIGFGAAAFAILLIGAVYVGIRCCRNKPSDEGDSSSMEISGVQYEMREEYGPKPLSRCSTCDTDAVRAESSLRADLGLSRSDRPSSRHVIEDDRIRGAAREEEATPRVNHSV
ncbi:hypothetical protein IF2G_01538 [Cordyceps javanica]|nr:hypothetical protein IF2G_01538 [Cordyceps javanica]